MTKFVQESLYLNAAPGASEMVRASTMASRKTWKTPMVITASEEMSEAQNTAGPAVEGVGLS